MRGQRSNEGESRIATQNRRVHCWKYQKLLEGNHADGTFRGRFVDALRSGRLPIRSGRADAERQLSIAHSDVVAVQHNREESDILAAGHLRVDFVGRTLFRARRRRQFDAGLLLDHLLSAEDSVPSNVAAGLRERRRSSVAKQSPQENHRTDAHAPANR